MVGGESVNPACLSARPEILAHIVYNRRIPAVEGRNP